MAMNAGALSSRAWTIYQEKLRFKLEPGHLGEFLVLNVESGEYEVGQDEIAVSMRAAEKFRPEVSFAMRVGQLTSGRIGGRFKGAAT